MIHVPVHVKIDEAVPVHIGESAGGVEGGASLDTGLRRDIREMAVSIVAVEGVGPVEVRNVKVDVAVVVVIRSADPHGIARVTQAGGRGGVREMPLPIIDVEAIDRGWLLSRPRQAPAVEKVQVRGAVPIGVEEDHS